MQLLLNHAFREHDDALKEELADGTGVSFETYRLLAVDGAPRERRRELQRINDEILNWRYACCGADVLHVSSVFEAWGAPGAHVDARIADVPGAVRSATLYDLIPLLFADAYLAPSVRAEYIATLGVFQQMDLILAISESARSDAIAKLDILPERIVNIGAAVSGAFGRIESIDPDRSRETLRRHGLRSRFVLYTGRCRPTQERRLPAARVCGAAGAAAHRGPARDRLGAARGRASRPGAARNGARHRERHRADRLHSGRGPESPLQHLRPVRAAFAVRGLRPAAPRGDDLRRLRHRLRMRRACRRSSVAAMSSSTRPSTPA